MENQVRQRISRMSTPKGREGSGEQRELMSVFESFVLGISSLFNFSLAFRNESFNETMWEF